MGLSSYITSTPISSRPYQYCLFESWDVVADDTITGAPQNPSGQSALTVGFLRDDSLPVTDHEALKHNYYKVLTTQQREFLQKTRSTKDVYAYDLKGRRMNYCGGYIDLTTVRLREFVEPAVTTLLFRCGYITICDISRDVKQGIGTIPGIGAKRLAQIEAGLAQHGLRFLTFQERNAGTIFGGEGFAANFERVLRHDEAQERRQSFKLIAGSRQKPEEPGF